MPSITINIDGIDQPRVLQDSVEIESVIGQVVDTCDFTIYDKYSNIVVPSMSEVIVTRNDTGERIFGGLAVYVKGDPDGPSRYWNVSCQDWTVLLDRSIIIQSYEANFQYDGLEGDKAIIASAFEQDVIGEFGTKSFSEIEARVNVDQGLRALAQQDFRYTTLREVLGQLSQYVGFDYYVDYYKSLHYYYREDNVAPYNLTDGATSATHLNYRNVTHTRDGTRLVNTFALFGDRLLSDAQAYVLAGDGVTTGFDLTYDTIRLNYALLPEPGQSTIRVDTRASSNKLLTGDRHDGGNGNIDLVDASAQFISDGVLVGDIVINQTDGSWGPITSVTETIITAVLVDGTENVWDNGDIAVIPQWVERSVTNDIIRNLSGFDVRHDALGKTLDFNTAPLNNDYAIRIRFTHNFVAGQVDTEPRSVRRYGDRVFARRVVASDVNSAQGIVQKMAHLKEQYSDVLEIVRCTVTDKSFPSSNLKRFEAGQWLRFTNNVLGVINKDMLIHRVVTKILGEELMEYELELRDWEVDIL